VASSPGEQGYAVSVAHVWRFRDGLVSTITSFESRSKAFEELGLDPSGLTRRSSDET
jgi:hypothetical protein